MVYLNYITCLRYTSLAGNPRYAKISTKVVNPRDLTGNAEEGDEPLGKLLFFVVQVDLLQSKATLLHMARMLSDGVMDGLPVKVTTKRSGKRQLDMDALFDAADADRGKIMAGRTGDRGIAR